MAKAFFDRTRDAIRFLPGEFLLVNCHEDDDGVEDSYLSGQVASLPRERFIQIRARTLLKADPSSDDCDEYYTLRLNLSHGTRWIEFGRRP